jgi:DivIVA domain-containing protein
MDPITADELRAARPGRPGWGQKGYAPAEVDELLARAADALDDLAAGRAPRMTAEDVHHAVFRKAPFGRDRGYDEDQVDALLDRVERSLRNSPLSGARRDPGHRPLAAPITADELRAVELGRPPLGRRGYAPDEVDAFLTRAAEALTTLALRRAPQLTADEVHAVVFGKPPLGRGRGYDEDQVDELLDRIEHALRTAR